MTDEMDQSIEVGTTVAGRYRIDGLVGQGGTGLVYRAQQLGLDRSVAIKVLRSELTLNASSAERFRREATAMAQISHPNIATIYDYGELPDGRAFLAMEFLDGPSLDAEIRRTGPLALSDALPTIRAICAGVGALHERGLVHRDLKPSNVIMPSTPGGQVKVVDFGLARLMESDSTLTGGMVIGTPAYMAPEIVQGGACTNQSDIYCIGLIAYELVTGRMSFTGPTVQAFIFQHVVKQPTVPSKLVPQAAPFDDIILQTLRKNADERPASATELSGAFAAALAAAPAASAPSKSGASILLVEDDESILRLVESILRKRGFTVESARDGVDALMKLGSGRFDLILSDVEMPHLDGYALVEMLSKKNVHIPVIFLTSHAGEDAELRGLALGAADYIKKPISPNLLLARVQAALHRAAVSSFERSGD